MVMTSDMWLGLFEPEKLKKREMFLMNNVHKSAPKEKKCSKIDHQKDVDKMVI